MNPISRNFGYVDSVLGGHCVLMYLGTSSSIANSDASRCSSNKQ
jgi:hypothetical protein